MDDQDDLGKLEELLAAEDSGDDLEGRTDTTEPQKPLFLQDIVDDEVSLLLPGKENVNNHIEVNKKSKISLTQSVNNTKLVKNKSIVHTGDTDSSDDEEKQNFLERKYSDYGMDVKKILKSNDDRNIDAFERRKNISQQSTSFKAKSNFTSKEAVTDSKDIYCDPIFGIRIVRPLLSSAALKERMQGREAVSMARVKRHAAHGDLAKDWVIAGAIVRKSASKESQKGAQYCIWTLSDLKDDLKTVAVFLFRNAYKQLWKTNQGTVVGILNPSVLDKRDDSTDQACLSVDNPEKIMIFGNSKDFGFCKSLKKNGDPCTTFVNINKCGHCIYHVQQEYQKCSRRSELQSHTSGRGLNELRNKVLGKNTYIYGGKEFSAIPATKSIKQTKIDNSRLQSLSDHFKPVHHPSVSKSCTPPIKKSASRVEVSASQRRKDLERLELLRGGAPTPNNNVILNTTAKSPLNNQVLKQSVLTIPDRNIASTSSIKSPINNHTFKQLVPNGKPLLSQDSSPRVVPAPTLGIPVLGFGLKKSSMVDLTVPFSQKQSARAKNNALKWIKCNGPLNKTDPNNIRGTTEGKKRSIGKLNTSSEEETTDKPEQTPKKPKTGVESDTFKQMMAATSAHSDLITQHEDSEADKYFDKLEKKEMMEEKMLNTFKVSCKAVRCLKCSYTSFSASEMCKKEKHPLKVFDAVKRFFKCSHCGNRQVSLDIIPTKPCRNCQNMTWHRTGMIAEKKGLTTASKLSITGEEEFLGHVQHGADINLLVPE